MTAAPAALAPTLAQAALIVAKSTLLLGVAAGGARALRRGSAAARHLVWALGLGGLTALPALVLLLPDWKPALLAILRPASATAWTDTAPVAASTASHPLLLLLAIVWAAGTIVVLCRLGIGLRGVGRLARAAEPVTDPVWTGLVERFAADMGVRRRVVLLRSREAAMPLTWGAFRPAILLPAGADGWSAERRRVVLLHELSHVARRDCLMQLLAEISCAFWWFHPGAWWAAREMRIEREQACDDRVLAAGARASDYAGHLLDVARAYRAPALAAAIAMARPSHLEGRVRAVLESARDRRAVTGRTAGICAAAVLLATLPLAAVAPSERAAPPPQVVAWRMPDARTWNVDPATGERLSIHGSAEYIAAPKAAVARTAPAARPAAAPAKRAPARQVAAVPERREPTVRVASDDGSVVATLEGNRVHAVIPVPHGVQVRVEGHGVRAVTSRGQLRVEADLDALNHLAAQLQRRAAAAEERPKARAEREAARRKVDADARRVAMNQKRDLGLRLLGA
jgi:beta-lactamase regulating signal transducer with metallopeptidase domain